LDCPRTSAAGGAGGLAAAVSQKVLAALRAPV
jgi:hypothetical protein